MKPEEVEQFSSASCSPGTPSEASLALPAGQAIRYGDLLGRIVDFAIVAAVVFLVLKTFVRPAPPAAPTRSCPLCLETIPAAARRCRACGADV